MTSADTREATQHAVLIESYAKNYRTMQDPMPTNVVAHYPGSKTAEYMHVIQEHVVRPLRDTAVAESCFAAAMLIFGAVDGLGRLVHRDADAGAGQRFRFFVARLGKNYARRKAALWRLRNSLAHNSMNVASFMSKTAEARGEHLEEFCGCVFVHTKELLAHFENALIQLESEFNTNPVLFQRAESRLQWAYIPWSRWKGGHVLTTQPPPIEFIQLTK